jgi:hypothetical protein
MENVRKGEHRNGWRETREATQRARKVAACKKKRLRPRGAEDEQIRLSRRSAKPTEQRRRKTRHQRQFPLGGAPAPVKTSRRVGLVRRAGGKGRTDGNGGRSAHPADPPHARCRYRRSASSVRTVDSLAIRDTTGDAIGRTRAGTVRLSVSD